MSTKNVVYIHKVEGKKVTLEHCIRQNARKHYNIHILAYYTPYPVHYSTIPQEVILSSLKLYKINIFRDVIMFIESNITNKVYILRNFFRVNSKSLKDERTEMFSFS